MVCKTKIVHILPRFFPEIGGLENMVFDLAKEQSKKNEVFILTLDPNLKTPEIEKKEGLKILRYPAFEIGQDFYRVPKKGFCKWFAKREFELGFTHTRFFLTSFLGGKVLKKKKTKWIHVEHGANFFEARNVFIRFITRIFDETFGKWVLKKADKVVVLTEVGKNFVNKLGRKKKVFIIPNGIKIIKQKKVFLQQNKALFIGRATVEKGIYEFLKTAKKCPNWEFSVIGNNKDHLKNTSNLKFLGELSRKEVFHKIAKSSLLISPSWGEGFGLAVLEAASLSRPIFATDVGVVSEIVSSEFIIPQKNSEILVKKINKLTNDFSILEKIGAENFERAKKFSFELMFEKYEKLIEK